MYMGKQSLSLLVLILTSWLRTFGAFRLFEFELRPTTTTSFTCTESIASEIEMAAETCLLNQCAKFVSEISFSYSNCTTQNSIAISGGLSVVNEGTIMYDPIETDTCVKSILESDLCRESFLAFIPSLSSMTFVSQHLAETLAPTKAPATSSPILPPTGADMTTAQPISSTRMPSLPPSPGIISSQPTTTPSIQLSSKPSPETLIFSTLSPYKVTSNPVASAPNRNDEGKSNKNVVALGAVFALTGLTVLLLGYLVVSTMRKREKDKSSTGRGPLDTTDTAFENDDDPEAGNMKVQQSFHPLVTAVTEASNTLSFRHTSKTTLVPLESFHNSAHTFQTDDDNVNIADNSDSLVLEDDELSSGSSTLFDLNGRNEYDDAASSVFYESQGEEDDEDGTEIELDGTWGPDESSVVSESIKEDDDGESMIGSTISSLGASGVENFGENPSPHQFMEWIKKSPLIPAAAKASIVAAAVAEVAAAEDRKPTSSPVTLPLNFNATTNSDASGRESW